jgi:hypothetical protein
MSKENHKYIYEAVSVACFTINKYYLNKSCIISKINACYHFDLSTAHVAHTSEVSKVSVLIMRASCEEIKEYKDSAGL